MKTSNSKKPAKEDATDSLEEVLSSAAWFKQQRYWEETTRVQTQLLALLQASPTTPSANLTGPSRTPGKRRSRRKSLAPATATAKHSSTRAESRRRGSWSACYSSSLMAARPAPEEQEADAAMAIQLLASHRSSPRPRPVSRRRSTTSAAIGLVGKAKEAEPSLDARSAGRESKQDQQHHHDPHFEPPSHSTGARSSVMSIASLLN